MEEDNQKQPKVTQWLDNSQKEKRESVVETKKEPNEFCIWDEFGEWFIGTVISNFRKVATKDYGDKFVVNIDIAEGKEHAIWLSVGGKIKGGTKNAGFLEALGLSFKDKEKFNPLELDIVGKEILCLWGTFRVKDKLKEGVIRFRKI